MKKDVKGQITIFIIVAVIIIGLVFIFFLIQNKPSNTDYSQEIAIINSFVEDCLSNVGEDAIYNIGQRGGYFNVPENSLDIEIPHYNDKFPLKEDLEKELEEYVDESLFFCTRNFIDFPDLKVEQGEIKTSVEIKDGKVLFKVDYPLGISKEEDTSTFNEFETEVLVKLDEIHKVSNEIVSEFKDSGGFCLNCLQKSIIEKNLYIEMSDYQDSVVISLIDKDYKIKGEDFRFYFAIRK